jgi:glucose-1-phosphate cytidylyltransferase
MKVVILAGGLGTRISEETDTRPKPMVEIGGKPILWHIMKIYSHYGFNEFVICCGYKGFVIKEYFANYFLHQTDVTFDLAENKMEIHHSGSEKWKVTLVDTGINTNTAGRIKKIESYLNNKPFMLTYGDGVANIDINRLIEFHKKSNRLATLTSIQLPGRFGNVETENSGKVKSFQEKPMGDGVWINGGFFVLQPEIFKYLEGDMSEVQWEKKPLIEIAKDGQLSAYKHEGFWKCMDAIRDKIELEELWNSGKAEWKVWK